MQTFTLDVITRSCEKLWHLYFFIEPAHPNRTLTRDKRLA